MGRDPCDVAVAIISGHVAGRVPLARRSLQERSGVADVILNAWQDRVEVLEARVRALSQCHKAISAVSGP